MLKACKYCGRIHDTKYNCGKKPVHKKTKYSRADHFRRTQAWTDKAIEIKQRDNYLCQICIRGLYNAPNKFNYKKLSVHHATPISEDWDKRLDDNNLITICSAHHEMAENGKIPQEVIRSIIAEQEQNGRS